MSRSQVSETHDHRLFQAENTPPDRFTALIAIPDEALRLQMVIHLSGMGATTVYEAESGAEAWSRMRVIGPCDLVVLDVDSYADTAVDLVPELRRAGCGQVVALVSRGNVRLVAEILAAGAGSLLVKEASERERVRMVRQYLNGATNGPLSYREIQVLQLVACGHNTKTIGEMLELSPLTVKSHVARIGRKLDTGDRAEMVAKALRAQLIW